MLVSFFIPGFAYTYTCSQLEQCKWYFPLCKQPLTSHKSSIISHMRIINRKRSICSFTSKQVSYRYLDKRKSPINGLFTPFMKLCLLFKLFFWFDFPCYFIVIVFQNRIILIRFCILLMWFHNRCTQIVHRALSKLF